ncbi:MAG: S46 family peptidase [Bacteroidales bacterium]|nr:S46 family peptidase [Bacteroidales bacterium]MCF8391554.1 S46 family peptidase [Bacteroidales bacterium]
MRRIVSYLVIVFLSLGTAKADEGMWLFIMLQNQDFMKMQQLGLELKPEEIFSFNNSSLKDAVGALDGGSCTAELVSPDGLLLTNHHCGYGEIQEHSSVEHNYLKNGFWAMSREDELPNPGKTITFVVNIVDVSDKIMPYLSADLTGQARQDSVASLSAELIKNATKDSHYDAYVRSFYNGNQYILFVNETFRDVRLVGAPPESIGKFGHDTDNWVWPRHTGDFSMFRVYTAPDGTPADYSADNVPLKSKHFLPISLKGYEKGDFAMVMGFPGSTDRYMTSWEVEELLDVTHPNRIKIRGVKQGIMMEDMLASEQVNIKYAAKYSRSSNYWKYSIGQTNGLNNLGVVERKQELEKEFLNWVSENKKDNYANTFNLIQRGVEQRKFLVHSIQYLYECMYSGMETVNLGNSIRFLYQELNSENPDAARVEMLQNYARNAAEGFFKDYNLSTDKKITRAMLQLMIEDVEDAYLPLIVRDIKTKYKGDIDKFVEKYYKKSALPYEDKVMAMIEKADAKDMAADPGIQMTMSFFETYMGLNAMQSTADKLVEEGTRLWMAGLMEMQSDKIFYPDANSTLRFTYGTVGDYEPKDAVYYSYFTTLKGVMEKEDPTNPEFIVSEKLKELYKSKDYGSYGNNESLNVCFTTNNDITGGNSGSPVINGKGELIGIAFDGNWEAMSGDVAFETELQKCINVDIRYVLFVIDKYAGAQNLINEMQINN